MSEHENELKKALAENGTFDAEKAKRAAAEAGAWFDARLKWLTRLTWIRQLICTALFAAAIVGFGLASSTKVMIGCAVLGAIAIIVIGVIENQYRITNTKVGLLKEIKLLRLENLGRPTDHVVLRARETSRTDTSFWLTISPWENTIWFLALILVPAALASGYFFSRGVPAPTIESYVTLAPNGAGTEVMNVSYRHSGFVPRSSFPFTTSDVAASIRWVDGQGRELRASATTSNGQRHFTVHLVEPVMPGEQVRYTQITETPASATKKEDLWTCRTDRAFGVEKKGHPPSASQLVVGPLLQDIREPKAAFRDTVQLPEGAEVVSVDPQSAGGGTWDGTPARIFGATRGRNEAFTCTIRYRLPKGDMSQGETK